MYAMDWGSGTKLQIYPTIVLPAKRKRGDQWYGLNQAEHLAATLRFLLERDDLVTESPTVGSANGLTREHIRDIVATSAHSLFTISCRNPKNWSNRSSEERDDEESAQYIYEIAMENPAALAFWKYRPREDRLTRRYRTVRPSDKWNYDDDKAREALDRLPPLGDLPVEFQVYLSEGLKGPKAQRYDRSLCMPFGQALLEPSVTNRASFEKVIGCYSHGYPSHYRRAFLQLVRKVHKMMFNSQEMEFKELKPKFFGEERPEELAQMRRQSKAAHQQARRCLRALYYYANNVPQEEWSRVLRHGIHPLDGKGLAVS